MYPPPMAEASPRNSSRRVRASTSTPRRRLELDQRREELIEVGTDLFTKRHYEDVSIDEIATRAGVSRGLLYHYFPTKRDFFRAVVRAQAARMTQLTAPDPALEPIEQLR